MSTQTIALSNQKGGVGKTVTAVNLGVGLAHAGKRVLLVDADPQASLTVSLGIKSPDGLDTTISTVMQSVIEERPPPDGFGIIHHPEGVDLLPANIELSAFELGLTNVMSREYVLREALAPLRGSYDYILIDCMPSLGMMSINALAAADSVIIPSQPSFLSTKGLSLLMGTISRVRRQINPQLRIDGVLLTMVDNRTNNAKAIIASLRQTGDMLKVFDTEIPYSVRAAETSIEGRSIFAHDGRGKVAAAYEKLTGEVRELSRDEAIVLMVESNLQRTAILPSEKAFAYKMRLEAMQRQTGRPIKNNSDPLGPNLIGSRSNEELASQSPDSKTQIQRYIRLTSLIPEILDIVDNSVLKESGVLQMAMRPAVELSYLSELEQRDLLETMTIEDCTPSLAQAIKLRDFSRNGKLNADVILSIMCEEKPNQKERISFRAERLRQFIPKSVPLNQTEDYVLKALEYYQRYRERQRQREIAR